ncbi:unnamed protein product [Lepeophtheirus salmonis]|uniref:(salmon louse) hypothetical protein n=1 Tax=Lepeophtheirus salmonis TaxID=72036 RepID=A0A7R8CFX6_LEPSM|nr:unnamed protein product [Lepeophtheirus salmonis]CAF2754261.1 unnamed protein product [Lepeophtheirus salmonis]
MRRKVDRETDLILRNKFLPCKHNHTATTIQKKIVVNNRTIDKLSELLKYFHKRFSDILVGERPNFPKKRRPSEVEVFTMATIVNFVNNDFKDSNASGQDHLCGRIFSLDP